MPTRLFVVDDSPEVATLLRWIARRSGRELTLAASAEEALTLLGPRPEHDLLLVDINLPGMDGIELSRLLLERGGKWPLAVFIQSGLAEDLSRAVRVGIEYALYKDFLAHPEQWNARCNEILTDLAVPPTVKVWGNVTGDPVKSAPVRLALETGLGMQRIPLVSALLERAWTRTSDAPGTDAPGFVPSEMPASQLARLADALDGLLWRLLGREESRAAREALRPFTLLASGGEPNA